MPAELPLLDLALLPPAELLHISFLTTFMTVILRQMLF